MPKVSVIIAVYKAEPFIERCARSLFGQTLDDIEYIFVDDCSPDRSIEVMQRVLADYPERKPLVRVIRHEVNQGVSITRQDGVDAATGDYIIHCDPDDWLDLDAYEVVYNEAVKHRSDLVMFDFYTKVLNPRSYKKYTAISFLEDMTGVSGGYAHGGLCNKLIRSNVAKMAKFPQGIAFCEDAYTLFQMLAEDIKVEYVRRPFYHYEYNPNSLCKSRTRVDFGKDRELLGLLTRLGSGKNTRYIDCIKAYQFAIIYSRVFFSRVYTNREFKDLYRQYLPVCDAFNRCTKVSKALVKLAMRGYHSQALFCFNTLSYLKRYLQKRRATF